jgi:ABC-type polysaccharide/polyol phosphate export permease
MADAALQRSDADRPDPFRALKESRSPTRFELAIDDLRNAVLRAWIPATMAWQDVRQRYRRSVLGPFWLTISMSVMILTLGFLYSSLFNLSINQYLPFLTLGLLFWTFISTVINEGCVCFIEAESMIRQMRMPFFTHVYRTILRNLIILAHNAVVYVAVQIYFHLPLSAYSLLVVPGLVMLLLNGIWVCLLLGMISARFRDVIPIVSSVVQIWFFITPVFWDPSSLAGRHVWLVDFNPIYALVETVRAPLLGQPLAASQWFLALGTTVVGCSVAFAFFTRFRARIPYWV